MAKQPYTVLSVGGSIIIPPTGFNIDFLKAFRSLIAGEVKKGRRFILVIGGGSTARQYQSGLRALGVKDSLRLDYLGIQTTILNANFVKEFLGDIAHHEVVANPTLKLRITKPVVVAAGWKPGCSTDTDAVLFAEHYGAKEIFNLSNVDYVYDKNPLQHPDAAKLPILSWKEYRAIVGDTWTPGMNYPFDPIATKWAEKLKLRVGFVRGTDLEQVKNALRRKKFAGTVIS